MNQDYNIQDIVHDLPAPIKNPHPLRFSSDSINFRYAQSQIRSSFNDSAFGQLHPSFSPYENCNQNQVSYEISEIMEKQSVKYIAQEQNKQENYQQKFEDEMVPKKMLTGGHNSVQFLQQNQDKILMAQIKKTPSKIQHEVQVPNQFFEVTQLTKIKQKSFQQPKLIDLNAHFIQTIQKPIEIPLPNTNLSKNSNKIQIVQQVMTIVPCTIVNANNCEQKRKNQSKEEPIFKFIDSQTFSQNQSRIQQKDKANVTDILLTKINELQTKVKYLEEARKQNSTNQNSEFYQSQLPNTTRSLKPNLNQQKQLSSSTNSTNNNQFKIKSVNLQKRQQQQILQIKSNVVSINLSTLKRSNSIQDEIRMLKQKLWNLQKTHVFSEQQISDNIYQNNQKGYNFKQQPKANQKAYCSPSRKQLQGKIVKRFGSRMSDSPSNSIGYFHESSDNMQESGFVRRKPDRAPYAEPTSTKLSNHSEFNYDNFEEPRKKMDSSAIFRKNLGPAVASRPRYEESEGNYQTLQFNPEQQKYLVTQSKQLQNPISKNQHQKLTFSQISIPKFSQIPTPQNTSQQLLQIGKLAFLKLRYPLTENTSLKIKRYKNCVHFRIDASHNILWHYQGKFYYGGWKMYGEGDGQRHGSGIQLNPGRYRFSGNFYQGKRTGFGQMVCENGQMYVGEWLDGIKHGRGRQVDGGQNRYEGSFYEGDWKFGKKCGRGVMYSKGKIEYEGEFSENMKNGYGQQYFENGDQYKGQYFNNKFHGKGEYLWKSGASYQGDFLQGKRNGRGIWKSGQNNYDMYEGEYENDNKNGSGVYRWANGAEYRGDFKNDLKHGEGSITYPNGKVVYMVWNNGNVDKNVSHSNGNGQKSHSTAKKRSNSLQVQTPASIVYKKGLVSRSSSQTLRTSAKSNGSNHQRGHPKGITFKRQLPQKIKISSSDLMKIKMAIGSSNSNHYSNKIPVEEEPRDPPYKGMQTSTNFKSHV